MTETASELKLRGYRDDMVGLRDGFGTVFIASQITLMWTILGPLVYDPTVAVLTVSVGAVALPPLAYFAGKARAARRELQKLKQHRLRGDTGE